MRFALEVQIDGWDGNTGQELGRKLGRILRYRGGSLKSSSWCPAT